MLKIHDHYVDEKQFHQTIDQLSKSKRFDLAYQLVDSLMFFNKGNGFLYFEKGFLEALELKGSEAKADFNMAERLNYSKKKCEVQIKICEMLENAKFK